MRRLGAALGVEAMSLYRHVASKDELLDAVGDAIVSSWTAPAVIMHRAHQVLLARPWAIELLDATYPAISRTIRERHDHGEEYTLMVDLVLDGLARLRDGERPPRTSPASPYPQLIG